MEISIIKITMFRLMPLKYITRGGGKTLDKLLDLVYPIGSVYISVASTSPSSLFGGSWEQIKDVFLLACGNTYKSGATGGSNKHSHILSENGWALHTNWDGSYSYSREKDVDGWTATRAKIGGSVVGSGDGPNKATVLGGSTNETSIMPPYLAVYVWKRTA